MQLDAFGTLCLFMNIQTCFACSETIQSRDEYRSDIKRYACTPCHTEYIRTVSVHGLLNREVGVRRPVLLTMTRDLNAFRNSRLPATPQNA